jgi:pimeloyl-ACP methyl ester carboxylesterase
VTKPMAFVIHGWFDNVNRTWVKTIVADYTKYVDTNVCAVDWNRMARVEYSLAAASTPDVASFLVKFIMLLQSHGMALDKITIVGHSLGAHIAGFVGAMFKGNIAEIIGLDPAGPGVFFKENGRLNATNAKFVQVLHTDQGFCGTTIVSGHQDFYPNNGVEPQPGCIVPFLQNGIGFNPSICSHYKAVEYFWASLSPDNKFRALQCPNYDEYLSGSCNASASALFGVHGDREVKGTFYLSVKANYPFFF